MSPSLQDFAIKLLVSSATRPAEEVIFIPAIDVSEDSDFDDAETIKDLNPRWSEAE